MKNKLLICFKPVVAEENSDDPSVFPLRKSKSFTITDFPDMVKRKKETNRSISGSFEAAVLALSFSQRRNSNGKVDLRRNRLESKSSRFSFENRRWNPRIKESPSEASLKLSNPSLSDREEEKQGIKNSDEKKKNRVMVADSGSRSKWAVYLIVVMSLFMTVFYGRVYSLVVTSSLSFCFLCRRKNLKILKAGRRTIRDCQS